ncbi:hypothetical protein QQF64_000128 [Cirrhinus molitorella]|uniref:Uncharacterized protein n=1 Tax=Cirrhinus molitorella TaxID=172907 RepID=A0ABR3NWA7_9TELE
MLNQSLFCSQRVKCARDRLCFGSSFTLSRARVRMSADAQLTSASGRERRDDWSRENADAHLLRLNRCHSAGAALIGRLRRKTSLSTFSTSYRCH